MKSTNMMLITQWGVSGTITTNPEEPTIGFTIITDFTDDQYVELPVWQLDYLIQDLKRLRKELTKEGYDI